MQGSNDNRTATRSLRPSHVRSAALAAAVVGVVVLPIAAAQANPSHGSAKQTSATGTPATGSPATASALLPQYCGATQTGLQGAVTAQSCVNYSAGAVTGVVYVGNSSAKQLTVAINLTRGDGSLAQMTCVVAAHDANGTCTTGALRDSAGKGAFDAIAEMLPVNAPLSEGVLHVESGQVTQSAGSSDGAAVPSASTGAGTAATPSAGSSTEG